MKLYVSALITALYLALPITGTASSIGAWTYEGPYGPQNWGLISEDFATCSQGAQQSPIDLSDPIMTELSPIEFHWKRTDWTAYNTGHTLQLQATDGGYIVLAGQRYDLMQFHFHTPSEHSIDGEHFPMVAHFVHVSKDNQIVVIAVMMKGGGRNPDFESVMAHTPSQVADPKQLKGFDPTTLIASADSGYRYQGSLTTPPCSETVLWAIFPKPLIVSDASITAFSILFGENARPVQPRNRRYLLTGGP